MEIDSTAEWNETLRKMARPDIYRVNAFRVLGLPVKASSKEVSSRIRGLDLIEKFGNEEQHESSFLAPSMALKTDARREAQQRLLEPELRFIDEFFWFWPLSLDSTQENDETVAAIRKQDLSRALSIWEYHETHGSEASISIHNLAVFYHAMALDIEYTEAEHKGISEQQLEQKRSYWQQAFAKWRRLLGEESFWNRVRERIRELDDPRLSTDTAERIREGLPKALLSINAMLAVEASEMSDPKDVSFHVALIRQSGFDNSIALEAIRRAVAPVRDRLKAMCLHCAEEISNAPESGNDLASSLIKDTAPLLKTLDSLLAKGGPTRESMHDEVAEQVRSCLVSFGNKTGDWRAIIDTAKKSLSIAESPSLVQKIKEDLQIIGANVEYSSCWFCGGGYADSDSSVTVMMHGNVERVPGLLQTQVRWQYLPVLVPRCSRCRSAHKRSKGLRIGGTVSAFFIAIVVGAITNSFWMGLMALGIVIAAAHGVAAGTLPDGIEPESHKNEFRTVKEMTSTGWKIGQRPKEAS